MFESINMLLVESRTIKHFSRLEKIDKARQRDVWVGDVYTIKMDAIAENEKYFIFKMELFNIQKYEFGGIREDR